MARSLVALADGVWTTLGTAEMTIELFEEGSSGHVLISNSGQNDIVPISFKKGEAGEQINNTKGTDTIDARATGTGWVLSVDI